MVWECTKCGKDWPDGEPPERCSCGNEDIVPLGDGDEDFLDALSENISLDGVSPRVADSGPARWLAAENAESGYPTPILTLSLIERFASQTSDRYDRRLLSAMRGRFGGHAVSEIDES